MPAPRDPIAAGLEKLERTLDGLRPPTCEQLDDVELEWNYVEPRDPSPPLDITVLETCGIRPAPSFLVFWIPASAASPRFAVPTSAFRNVRDGKKILAPISKTIVSRTPSAQFQIKEEASWVYCNAAKRSRFDTGRNHDTVKAIRSTVRCKTRAADASMSRAARQHVGRPNLPPTAQNPHITGRVDLQITQLKRVLRRITLHELSREDRERCHLVTGDRTAVLLQLAYQETHATKLDVV